MKYRKIPYGYKMINGEYVLDENESQVVKLVFTLAEAGKTSGEIFDAVRSMDSEYFTDDISKSVSKITCLLYKEYYSGTGEYPAIISKERFDNARRIVSSRSHHNSANKIKIPLKHGRCSVCGGYLFKTRNPDDLRWKCKTVGCINRVDGIKEEKLYSQITSILQSIQADSTILERETTLTEYRPIVNVRMGENEVVMRCHIKPVNDERVRKEIIKLAALKYDCCTYDRAIYQTKEILDRLSAFGPVTDVDSLLVRDIAHKVLLIDSEHIAIEFINGKTITYGGQ